MLFSIILVLISFLFFIPLTISLTYFLDGALSIIIGIKEKNNFKAKTGVKRILYSLIIFIATLLIVPLIATFIGETIL